MSGALPCPFCGGNSISVNEGSTFRWRYAECNECGARAGEVRHNTLSDDQDQATTESTRRAIEEWNTRTNQKESE